MGSLEGKIDEIVEMLIAGDSYRAIAEKLDVPLSTLHKYTSTSEHSARAKEALLYSASSFDDKAEEVLLNAPGTLVEIQRAKELAQHYRWKAAKRAPKIYGEKIDVTSDGEKLKGSIIKWGDREITI
jgi:hypothetical protein